MKHLKPFMESAGLLWRQVTEEEMERKMRGKVIDTITKGEIQKVINLLKESGRAIEIVEFQINAKTLEIDIFNETVADTLRHHWLQSDTKKVWYPRIATNNLLIKSDTAAVRQYFEIFKCDDDYFWVESSDDDYFICDGIQGLLSMLADYYTIEKKSNP
jgi:hypothetical protein